MLVYLHIPFCRRRCSYCAFSSQALGHAPVPQNFVRTLLEELAFWGEHRELLPTDESRAGGTGPQSVSSVFFGGGTPSLLAARDIAALLDACARHFSLEPDAEITMEGNPESMRDKAKVRDYVLAGVSRLSMGVQSMQQKELALLGRIHTAADVALACRAARAAHVRSLNLDLMWALPFQTRRGWLETLRAACGLDPDHLSCYALTPEQGTELGLALEQKRLTLPDEETASRMYLEGCAFLESRGLCQYEISNFSRDGHQCRHNLGYWHGAQYLGLGPSAVSTINGQRFANPCESAAWAAAVRQGSMLKSCEPLSAQDRLRETVMLRLRTTQGLPLALYRALRGQDFVQEHGSFVKELVRARLMTLDDTRAALTSRGLLVSNDIVARLFADMEDGA